jgi:predicted aspartyl protease
LRFRLDTGVSSTIITDPEVAQKIGYKYVRTVAITGAGEGEPLMAQVSIGHTLRLGDVQAFQQNLVVLNEDILHLSDFMGIPSHGIFGYDLFNTFVVTIDYENKELFLRSNESFSPRPRRYGQSYPMTVTQSKPYIESMSISVIDSVAKPVRLVIDTGAGHALLLNQESENGTLPLPQKVIRANLGRGLNGDISGHVGRVHTVKIGSLKLHNVLASFPDVASFGNKFLAQEQSRQGSVGGEFLRRFRVTFDYREGRLFLKPNKPRVREPFEHDMSGLEIRGKNKDYSQVYIQKVIMSSPAEGAGLQPGAANTAHRCARTAGAGNRKFR